MKNRVLGIFPVVCSLAMAAGVVYAEFKKGYYSPAELGSLRQAAPIQLLPDANYQVSAYPVPAVDLIPGNGLQDVQIYCNTCHGPRCSGDHVFGDGMETGSRTASRSDLGSRGGQDEQNLRRRDS